jgi:chromate reductase, NAD(P)H dehydrogenase (quinone)
LTVQILTICGSLRTHSSNLALLEAVEQLAPSGTKISRYRDIANLPHFSPDQDLTNQLPEEAQNLRDKVAAADGLLFAVPEYMHSLPGSFKNALDWMVGCQKFPGKPVALAHVNSRHAFAPAQLEEVLKTMAAEIVPEAGFNLGYTTNQIEKETICGNEEHVATITRAVEAFRDAILLRKQ